jgi:hypothetical protein
MKRIELCEKSCEYERLYDSLWEHYNENHPFSLAEWMVENKEVLR